MHGDTARTVPCHEEILAITEPHSELWYRSHSLWNLGVVAWRQGGPRRAGEAAEQRPGVEAAVGRPPTGGRAGRAEPAAEAGDGRHLRGRVVPGYVGVDRDQRARSPTR